MARPLFSIVTVTLNAGVDLMATAKSVADQSMISYEHIIKDGGSFDNSLALLKKDNNQRIIIKPDSGIYEAMNQALEYCTGKYILFLNAGDVFASSDVLSLVANTIVCSDMPEVVYTHIKNMRHGTMQTYPSILSRAFLYRRSLCHQGTYIRRDCYAKYGNFDLMYRILADNELLLRLLTNSARTALSPCTGVIYKGEGFSMRESNAVLVLHELKRIRKKYYTKYERLYLGVLWHLTMPTLRMWLIKNIKSQRFQNIYAFAANMFNQSAFIKNKIPVCKTSKINRFK